jgi:hypothetical protein
MSLAQKHFRNNKTNDQYYVLHDVTDCTNSRDGTAVVVYRHSWFDVNTGRCIAPSQIQEADAVFTRDRSEFLKKFTEIQVHGPAIVTIRP